MDFAAALSPLLGSEIPWYTHPIPQGPRDALGGERWARTGRSGEPAGSGGPAGPSPAGAKQPERGAGGRGHFLRRGTGGL
jgi:hypothetical protein